MSEQDKSLSATLGLSSAQRMAPADRQFVINAFGIFGKNLAKEIVTIRAEIADLRCGFEGDDVPRCPVAILSAAFLAKVGLPAPSRYLVVGIGWDGEPFASRCDSKDLVLEALQERSPFRLNCMFTGDDEARKDWTTR